MIDLDGKLATYLTAVNGEDPELLVIWSKIAPEKAAAYADKMPAPQRKSVSADELAGDDKSGIIEKDERKSIISVKGDQENSIIEEGEQKSFISVKSERQNSIIENGDRKSNLSEGAGHGNGLDGFEVIDRAPDAQIPDEDTMNERKAKLLTIKANLDRVVHAYTGHTNSEEYNRMLRKLTDVINAEDPEQFAKLSTELGEEARKYLDHTGVKTARHTNSEIRRKCAFLIMSYTDDPLYANYVKRANQKRSGDDQITTAQLENMPGVGAPAPASRTRVSIHDLADEQREAEGRKGRDRRSVRSLPESGEKELPESEERKSTSSKK